MPILIGDSLLVGLSDLNLKTPMRYKNNAAPSITHIPRKISFLKMPQCPSRSALERNFIARISSAKPNTFLTVSIHPPDLGSDLSRFGKKANNVNGSPRAKPKDVMPTTRLSLPSAVAERLPSSVPIRGPVHEKETMTNVRAIKKIPMSPPTLEAESTLVARELGSAIS